VSALLLESPFPPDITSHDIPLETWAGGSAPADFAPSALRFKGRQIVSVPGGPGQLDHIWQADQLAHRQGAVCTSGYAALDAELPGGGWPLGALTEILQVQPGLHEWRLLLPALVTPASTLQAAPVVLVGAPLVPFGPALAAQGLAPERLLWVRPAKPVQRLWATEQALRCAPVGAVVAWLPQARPEQLRRLHWAAQTYQKLLFVFRPVINKEQASPAPLRLEILPTMAPDPNPQGRAFTHALALHILKRRGPSLARPIELPLLYERLQQALQASRWRRAQRHPVPTPLAITPVPQILAPTASQAFRLKA
jgi:protein ImuA